MFNRLVVLLVLFFPLAAIAESNFSFSPPPITQVVSEGETKSRITGLYMNIDVPGDSITAVGANFVQRSAINQSSAFSYGVGGVALGNESATTTGFFLNGNGNFELYINDDPSAIAFIGMPYGLGVIDIEEPGLSLTSVIFTVGVQVGLQKHIWMGNNTIVVPYVVFSSTYGSTSTTGTIDTGFGTVGFSETLSFDYTTTTFGLDILIENISIGSMINTGADDDILIIQVGYGF